MKTAAESQIAEKSRRALMWGVLYIGVVTFAIWWVGAQTEVNGLQWPLRRVLDANGDLTLALSSDKRVAETYPKGAVPNLPRKNGFVGMSKMFDPVTWTLTVEGGRADHPLTIQEIKALPVTETVTRFKCVEGWSQILQAKGTKFSDFMRVYGPPLPAGLDYTEENLDKLPKYVGLETPDGAYYVGIDMKSMLHPQTVLCWEEDGKPLSFDEGQPLRLIIPLKYGIKNIKRIGKITFSNERPKDYWFKRGYDYYAGH